LKGEITILKETITYTDFDGNERTEDFYFNMTKAELIEMNLEVAGGMEERLRKIVAAKDQVQIIAAFKDLICRAYGEKSPDGKRFVKSKELTDAFIQTEAYSDLFMRLATDAEAATRFVNNILPKVA
jgi:hypothetical protein